MMSVYEFPVPSIPGQQPEVYMAKITGEDPEYIYRREFIDLIMDEAPEGYQYKPVHFDEYGIYEISIKWHDAKQGGEFLRRERYWFVMIDQTECPLPQEMVFDTLHWIKRYEKAMGGDVA